MCVIYVCVMSVCVCVCVCVCCLCLCAFCACDGRTDVISHINPTNSREVKMLLSCFVSVPPSFCL